MNSQGIILNLFYLKFEYLFTKEEDALDRKSQRNTVPIKQCLKKCIASLEVFKASLDGSLSYMV